MHTPSMENIDVQTVYGAYADTKKQNPISDMSMDFIAPAEFKTEWKRWGLIADFIAQFNSFKFFHRQQAISALSTIANELLENAVKFCARKYKLVSLTIRHFGDVIEIETFNISDASQAKKLENFVDELSKSDPETMFFDRIETAAASSLNTSGLGIITIAKDYECKTGIKITKSPHAGQFYDILVKVVVPIEFLETI